MILTPRLDDEGTTTLYLLSDEQHAFCKKELLKYQEGLVDWPEKVNDILDVTEVKPGSVIAPCKLSTGVINTAGDGGGWYEND